MGCLFAAYLAVIIPIGVTNLVIELCPVTWLYLFLVIFVLMFFGSVALFGYVFTRLYTYSTWGHEAVKDMSKNDLYSKYRSRFNYSNK